MVSDPENADQANQSRSQASSEYSGTPSPSETGENNTDGSNQNSSFAQENASEKPTNVEVKSETTNSDIAGNNITANRVELHEYEQAFFFNETGQVEQSLSERHFTHLGLEELSVTQDLIVDPSLMKYAQETLLQHRILLLSGPSELGKTSIAKYLSAQLLRRTRSDNSASLPTEVLIKQQLEQQYQTSLQDICNNASLIANRILIFTDPFLSGNTAFDQNKAIDSNEFSGKLKKHNAFIILTAESSSLNSRWQAFSQHISLPEPDRENLQQFLDRLATQYQLNIPESDQQILITELKTFPRLKHFAERFFKRLYTPGTEQNISLEDALSQHNNTANWFLNEAFEHNQDAWRLCLATLLGHAHTSHNLGVSSFTAHRLSDMLRRHLRKQSFMPDPKHAHPFLKHDAALLSQARLEYVKSDTGTLKFTESAIVHQLWQALLGSGHSLLVVLLPFLQKAMGEYDKIAHFHHADDGPELSKIAAMSIGRIGVLAPNDIITPIIKKELTKPYERAFLPLINLFIGIVASENDEYRKKCLDNLYQSCKRHHQPDYIYCYMLVLREIGQTQTNMALRKIAETTQDLLSKIPENILTVSNEINKEVNFGAGLREYLGYQSSSVKQKHQTKKMLFRFFLDKHKKLGGNLISPLQEKTYFATTFSLVGLCFTLSPVEIASQCLPYLKSKGQIAIMGQIWLDRYGVFEKMKRAKTWVDFDDFDDPIEAEATSIAIVTTALQEGSQQTLESFIEFLLKLDKHLDAFPAAIATMLHNQLLYYVKFWTLQAIQTIKGGDGMLIFYKLLLKQSARHNRQLHSDIIEMMQGDNKFMEGRNKRFASKVLRAETLHLKDSRN